MNTTALNRSATPQQAEKTLKTGANKAQGDGSESALFSGMLQQCLDAGRQNQGFGILNETEGHKDLADGSLTAIEIKLSTSVNLTAQSAPQVEMSESQALDNTGQVQKNGGSAATPTGENLDSALSGFDSSREPWTQNLKNTPVQPQMARSIVPEIAGNPSVKVNPAELAAAPLSASGHPQTMVDGAMTEALSIAEGLSEAPAQDLSLQSKLLKPQEVMSQSGHASITEASQFENTALDFESNANDNTDNPKDQLNPKHHSEAAATTRTTVEGLQSQKASPSKESPAVLQNTSEVVGSHLSGTKTLEDAALAPQLPKSASVRELPAIWTQHAQLLRAGETKTLRMMLNPEQLGALEIELSLKNGILSGIVTVETELAHDLIQKQLPQFLSTLDSKQIDSGGFEMHYRGDYGGFSESSGKDSQYHHAGQSKSLEGAEVDQGLIAPQEITKQNYLHKRIDMLA